MCRWPWSHKWSKWGTISGGDTLASVDPSGMPYRPEIFGEHKPVTGKYENQRRECVVCGKSQLRETSTL
jgi:hypothetical protein